LLSVKQKSARGGRSGCGLTPGGLVGRFGTGFGGRAAAAAAAGFVGSPPGVAGV
jgi:hypothetical protein